MYSRMFDKIELLFTLEIYLDKTSRQPDLRTTNKIFNIPVIRTSNMQKVEQYKLNHDNALTLMIAITSLLGSAWSIFDQQISKWITDTGYELYLAIISGISLVSFAVWALRPPKDRKQLDEL